MKSLRAKLILVLCSFWLISSAQIALDIPEHLRQANISFIVSDAASGRTIASIAPERCATPASITKLITTATALETLGAKFQFVTKVAYDGTFHDGVIDGNVYIIGSGDPSLGSRHVKNAYYFLENWCQKMRQAGIKKITGNIVADASVFDHEAVPPRWTWEDIGNYYAAGVYGLSAYDNTLNILMRSDAEGTQPTILNVTPKIADLQLYNHAKSTKTEMDSAYVYGMPYDNRRWILGAVPANRGQFLLKGDIPNPPLCVAQLFKERLQAYGIEISGNFTDEIGKNGKRTLLFEHRSRPLSELCRITNFISNNNYAEHIFRRMSVKNGCVGSNNGAIKCVTDFWKANGVDFQGISLNDGSGLSPMNAFSADFLNAILLKMSKSPNFETFLATIPIAGKEGSVTKFLTANKTAEVHAKSGSMDGVQSYAGYIIKNGKIYTFCLIINNFETRRSARKTMAKWLLDVIETL